MGSYGIYMILSGLISAVMGGGAVQLFNIRANKKKANSEASSAEAIADGQELNNVAQAIKIWKQMAEDLKLERDELKNEIKQLKSQNRTIIKLLKTITPENKADVIAEIENKIID